MDIIISLILFHFGVFCVFYIFYMLCKNLIFRYKVGDCITLVSTKGEFTEYHFKSYYKILKIGKNNCLLAEYRKIDNCCLNDEVEKTKNYLNSSFFEPYTPNNNKPSGGPFGF